MWIDPHHLLHQTLLFRRQSIPFPCILDVLLGGDLGVKDIETHIRLDTEIADKGFSFIGGISKFLCRRNVLIEGQGAC